MVKLKLSWKSSNDFFGGLIPICLAWYEFCGREAEEIKLCCLAKQPPFELIKFIRICSIKLGLATYLIMNLNKKLCIYLKMNNKIVSNEFFFFFLTCIRTGYA